MGNCCLPTWPGCAIEVLTSVQLPITRPFFHIDVCNDRRRLRRSLERVIGLPRDPGRQPPHSSGSSASWAAEMARSPPRRGSAPGTPERAGDVQIVVDEWCDTLDDIRLFRRLEWGCHPREDTGPRRRQQHHNRAQGGSRRTPHATRQHRRKQETDRSAQVSANIAVALRRTPGARKAGDGRRRGMMIVSVWR
jgi:hypothetical protein